MNVSKQKEALSESQGDEQWKLITKSGKKALCFDGQGTNIASSSRPSEQEMEVQPGVITINLRTHDECRMLECERIEQLQ